MRHIKQGGVKGRRMKFEHQDHCEWSRMEAPWVLKISCVSNENITVILGDTVTGFASVNCGKVEEAMDIGVCVCEI